jgi:hypothetical protein
MTTVLADLTPVLAQQAPDWKALLASGQQCVAHRRLSTVTVARPCRRQELRPARQRAPAPVPQGYPSAGRWNSSALRLRAYPLCRCPQLHEEGPVSEEGQVHQQGQGRQSLVRPAVSVGQASGSATRCPWADLADQVGRGSPVRLAGYAVRLPDGLAQEPRRDSGCSGRSARPRMDAVRMAAPRCLYSPVILLETFLRSPVLGPRVTLLLPTRARNPPQPRSRSNWNHHPQHPRLQVVQHLQLSQD